MDKVKLIGTRYIYNVEYNENQYEVLTEEDGDVLEITPDPADCGDNYMDIKDFVEESIWNDDLE